MRGFKEVGWVAAVAGTALGCYMVNLKVASERAALEEVSTHIVLAQRDIRVLQTEIGTRGRLEQLESWNVKVLALSAPQAHQFLEGGYQLASLTAPKTTVDPAAPVVLASASAPAEDARQPGQESGGASARDMMHVASLRRDAPALAQKAVEKTEPVTDKVVKASARTARPLTAPDRDVAPKERAGKERASGKERAAPTKTTAARPRSPTEKKPKDVQAR